MKKILIVDDQKMIRKLVNMSLATGEFESYEAENGTQALDVLTKESVDLIVLDSMMPGEIDGIGVCKAVKALPSLKHIPIIFLSAKSQKADIEEGLNAGADDYLLKPFSPEKLLDKVKLFFPQ